MTTQANNVAIESSQINSSGVLQVAGGGTGVTTSTGTGALVLNSSPTFIGTTVIPTINSGTSTALTLQSNGTTAITVDTSQNVGIGAVSGGARLQVTKTGAVSVLAISSDTTNSGLQITDGTINGVLYASGLGGIALYATSNHPLIFGTNNTTRMTISSTGNVGIGVVPNAGTTNSPVIQLGYSGGSVYMFQNGPDDFWLSSNLYYNSGWIYGVTNTGTQMHMGTRGFYFQSVPSGTAGTTATPNAFLSCNNGQTLALQGASSVAGTGISFPATQSASSDANTLDDYEEGTYTPNFTGAGSSPTVGYATQSGVYTKIGRMVYFTSWIQWSSFSGGSGNLQIGGLPFTNASNSVNYDSMSVWFTGMSWTGSAVTGLLNPSTTYFWITGLNNPGYYNPIQCGQVGSSGEIRCTGFYFV